jgi:hypoxanthine phosphoribosyltransferase
MEREKKILLTAEQIHTKVVEIAKIISKDYAGQDIVLVGVLKGCLIFMADLIQHLECPFTCDFVQVTTSFSKEEGEPDKKNIFFTSNFSIKDKDVLVIEDILDTGITASYLMNHLKLENPRSLKICVLLDKPTTRRAEIEADYVGFEVPDKYIFGYGLDYNEYFRGLPYICYFED